jgi:tetratricopeptide (TPR) repeat protein
LASLTLLLALASTAAAQFWDKLSNPRVPIPIQHPPGLGRQVNKVAFGPATGDGAQEFIDSLTERFVRANVEVLERQALETLLREHNLSLSGYVDKQSAAEMGKILGPAMLIFVSMPRRTVQQKQLYDDWQDGKGVRHRTWISQTKAFMRGSVRTVDLATGRIFAATTLESSPVLQNKAEDQCCPEYPSEFDALDRALDEVVGQAHRLYLPWAETREVYFFDDKDCNLKAAHKMLKAGDVDGMLQQSLANLETCKALPPNKTKQLAHAYHNLGIAYFAKGEIDKAVEYVTEAQRTRPADIHTEALADFRRAKAVAEAMQQVQERMALEASATARAAAAKAATAAAGKPSMTNKDVSTMAASRLPDAVIISKIKGSTCAFDIGTEALVALKKAGVSDAVMLAVTECGK